MPTNPMVSEYARSYNSFGGVDIKAVFGSKGIGELQAISFSITREKAPIYTMGSPNPRSFSRGKRGIAGSLIFTVFDRPSLYTMLEKHKADESVRYFTRAHNILPGMSDASTVQHRGMVPV